MSVPSLPAGLCCIAVGWRPRGPFSPGRVPKGSGDPGARPRAVGGAWPAAPEGGRAEGQDRAPGSTQTLYERGFSRISYVSITSSTWMSLNDPSPVSYTHLRAHETRHDL